MLSLFLFSFFHHFSLSTTQNTITKHNRTQITKHNTSQSTKQITTKHKSQDDDAFVSPSLLHPLSPSLLFRSVPRLSRPADPRAAGGDQRERSRKKADARKAKNEPKGNKEGLSPPKGPRGSWARFSLFLSPFLPQQHRKHREGRALTPVSLLHAHPQRRRPHAREAGRGRPRDVVCYAQRGL